MVQSIIKICDVGAEDQIKQTLRRYTKIFSELEMNFSELEMNCSELEMNCSELEMNCSELGVVIFRP